MLEHLSLLLVNCIVARQPMITHKGWNCRRLLFWLEARHGHNPTNVFTGFSICLGGCDGITVSNSVETQCFGGIDSPSQTKNKDSQQTSVSLWVLVTLYTEHAETWLLLVPWFYLHPVPEHIQIKCAITCCVPSYWRTFKFLFFINLHECMVYVLCLLGYEWWMNAFIYSYVHVTSLVLNAHEFNCMFCRRKDNKAILI